MSQVNRRFRDGSYNPTWPWDAPTAAAVLTTGGRDTGNAAVSFDDIRISLSDGLWTAEAEDSGRTWRGTADSNAGAVLALLADRLGMKAVVTLKPEPDEESSA